MFSGSLTLTCMFSAKCCYSNPWRLNGNVGTLGAVDTTSGTLPHLVLYRPLSLSHMMLYGCCRVTPLCIFRYYRGKQSTPTVVTFKLLPRHTLESTRLIMLRETRYESAEVRSLCTYTPLLPRVDALTDRSRRVPGQLVRGFVCESMSLIAS